jgi:hypothetical protein
MRRSVDFPEPDVPTITEIVPRSIASDTLSTTGSAA